MASITSILTMKVMHIFFLIWCQCFACPCLSKDSYTPQTQRNKHFRISMQGGSRRLQNNSLLQSQSKHKSNPSMPCNFFALLLHFTKHFCMQMCQWHSNTGQNGFIRWLGSIYSKHPHDFQGRKKTHKETKKKLVNQNQKRKI